MFRIFLCHDDATSAAQNYHKITRAEESLDCENSESDECGCVRIRLTDSVKRLWMIFLLDNYDSFTFNLVQRIGEICPEAEIRVERNDQTTIEQIEELAPERIIISPGPCSPAEAGLSCDIISHFGPKLPVLGVCLGHQCMAEVFGAKVVRAQRLMHGKTSLISHNGSGVV